MKTVKLKIPHGKKSELVVSCQVVTIPLCGLLVIFCSFISHLIGRETNIPEMFSGVHSFTAKTVKTILGRFDRVMPFYISSIEISVAESENNRLNNFLVLVHVFYKDKYCTQRFQSFLTDRRVKHKLKNVSPLCCIEQWTIHF